ncbi:MAG: hypothetical protein COA97_01975 [Flavobacteriales bacterium]|nr:MAG: hypothetical protein COA97_01975 [Flavobacteriales bacterium]
MKIKLIASIMFLTFFACSETKEVPKGKSMSLTDSKTTTCQLIIKEFTNKGGKVTEYKELYLRCSIQDYFIKICEGNVTAEELKPYIGSGIEVIMEIKEGMLDHCDENPAYSQSRTGTYIVINKIIE